MTMAGLWDGLDSAPIFERGTYFAAPGIFVVQVDRCMVKPTQASGLCFLVEFQIVESNRPENPPGSRGTWIQKLDNRNVALPNVKALVYAALGLNGTDAADAPRCAQVDGVIKGIMALATSESNGLAGAILRLETEQTTTKAGDPFTRHKFHAFPFEARGIARTNWDHLVAAAGQAQAAPVYAPPPPPPAWGARPVAPPPPVLGVAPGWGPVPPGPAYAPPPPPPPPPPARTLDPSGRYYLDPATNTWIPV